MKNSKVIIFRNCAEHLFYLCIQLLEKCESLNFYQEDYNVNNIVVNFDQITGWSVEWCDADLIKVGKDLFVHKNAKSLLKNFFNKYIYPYCFK